MPKRPTSRALNAEKMLLNLLGTKSVDSTAPLPTVRQLGEQLGLSYATVSRLLQRFAKEGRAWQHPNGRFYPVHAGPQAAAGLPIVVLGREIQNWSRLYQEIIEGVSEVCTIKRCPLVFLSSNKLVHHKSPGQPPRFASQQEQNEELQGFALAMPRICGGILFDHLWEESLVEGNPFASAPKLLMGRQSSQFELLSNAPDFHAGAQLILDHLQQSGCKRVYLGVPFKGDPAVDAAGDALLRTAKASPFPNIESLDCSTPATRQMTVTRLGRVRSPTALVCTEDNVTLLLWQTLVESGLQNSKNIILVSMQGTSAIDIPIARLRYDYRQLGRDAVTAVIERRKDSMLLPPTLQKAIP